MDNLKINTAPFYVKLASVLISLMILGYLTIIGKEILAPLVFAFLFAILLLPVATFFEKRWRLPRSAASGLAVVSMLIFIVIIIYTIGTQLSRLSSDWPMLKEQVSTSIKNMQDWFQKTFHINHDKQTDYIQSATDKLFSSSTTIIATTMLSLSSILLFVVFIMIDTFFLLFYRRLIMRFFVNVFKKEYSVIVYDVVEQVQLMIRKYILGLLLEMAIVATVCCIAFTLLGIKYSFLLGLITGIFNIIPYIGIFTALLLSALITFATSAVLTKVLLVVITVVVMHLVDSNILLPLIVASKVRINALITLTGVILGEMMWGISGMFLAIPVLAVTKIIFDRIDGLRPWGLLFGDEPGEEKPNPLIERLKKQSTKKQP